MKLSCMCSSIALIIHSNTGINIPYTVKFWRPLNLAKSPEMARYKIWGILNLGNFKFGDRQKKYDVTVGAASAM